MLIGHHHQTISRIETVRETKLLKTIDDFIEAKFDKFVAQRQNERIDVLPNQFDRMILTF